VKDGPKASTNLDVVQRERKIGKIAVEIEGSQAVWQLSKQKGARDEGSVIITRNSDAHEIMEQEGH
jgi:hypothetical protein